MTTPPLPESSPTTSPWRPARSGMDDDGQLDCGHGHRRDASHRPELPVAGDEGGDLAALIGEQLAGKEPGLERHGLLPISSIISSFDMPCRSQNGTMSAESTGSGNACRASAAASSLPARRSALTTPCRDHCIEAP